MEESDVVKKTSTDESIEVGIATIMGTYNRRDTGWEHEQDGTYVYKIMVFLAAGYDSFTYKGYTYTRSGGEEHEYETTTEFGFTIGTGKIYDDNDISHYVTYEYQGLDS